MIKSRIFRFHLFSKKQRQVLNWWCPTSPVNGFDGIIADGAIRSGKTISMSLAFIMWSMNEFDGENFGMCGKTIGSFRRNVLKDLKKMISSRGYKYEDRRADNLLEVRKGKKLNYYYIFGGKDESSQDLIQGITLAGVFFDEVVLMPQSFVNQATGRCSVAGSKYWFNCNPDGPYHWFKNEWIDKAENKNILYLHFTMNDNLSLSEKIKERYRNMYTGVFYDRYIRGMWAVAEGIIYDMFSKESHVKKIIEYAQLLVDGGRFVSCDYGTQNATVFQLWNPGIDNKYYCTREYYYSGRDSGKQKTDTEYADDLVNWLGTTKVKAIIVDPSAASFIAELRKRGLKVIKAKNDVKDGIRLVGTALNLNRIAYAEECKETIKEYGSYVWDEKAARYGDDKPIKQHDHCMDATRYFVMTVMGNHLAKLTNMKKR